MKEVAYKEAKQVIKIRCMKMTLQPVQERPTHLLKKESITPIGPEL